MNLPYLDRAIPHEEIQALDDDALVELLLEEERAIAEPSEQSDDYVAGRRAWVREVLALEDPSDDRAIGLAADLAARVGWACRYRVLTVPMPHPEGEPEHWVANACVFVRATFKEVATIVGEPLEDPQRPMAIGTYQALGEGPTLNHALLRALLFLRMGARRCGCARDARPDPAYLFLWRGERWAWSRALMVQVKHLPSSRGMIVHGALLGGDGWKVAEKRPSEADLQAVLAGNWSAATPQPHLPRHPVPMAIEGTDEKPEIQWSWWSQFSIDELGHASTWHAHKSESGAWMFSATAAGVGQPFVYLMQNAPAKPAGGDA